MATRIDSIAFQNFYNYYGPYERNTYEFEDGLNLIIADNGGGKSKFFNGILWILYDQVLDSETKKPQRINNSGFLTISDKAKAEIDIDDDITTGVQIEFSDKRNSYQVVKEIRAFKREDGSPTDEENWMVNVKETQVNIRKKTLHDFKPEFDKDQKKRIINKLLRPEFRDYALLQGEEVDKIIDLTDSDSLSRAIDTLSNIKDIEKLSELSSYLLGRAQKDLDKKRKDVTDNVEEHDNLIQDRDSLEEKIKKAKSEIKANSKELTEAENEKEDLLNSIEDAKEREDLRSEIERLEKRYDEIDKKHAQLHEEINNYFFDDRYAWLLLGLNSQIEEFSNRREGYLEAREDKRAERKIAENPEKYLTELPANVPDSLSLKRMLKKETCFVCGRKAKEDSEAWNHIKEVKERPEKNISDEPLVKNNLSKFFDNLQTNTRAYYSKIDRISESVKAKRKEEEGYVKEKENLSQQIEDKNKELLGVGGKNPESEEDIQLIRQFSNIESRIARHKNNKSVTEDNLEDLKTELKKVNNKLDKLSGKTLPDKYKRNHEVLTDLDEAVQNTRKRILDEMVQQLENEANKHFENLTKHSGIKGSNLRFVKTPNDTIRMKVEDSNGNIVTGESEGFQRMKKLAVIMAIITSSSKGILNYPLIADAPISAFGKSFMRGFFEQVPEVFHQSIILVKDLYDKEADDKLTDFGSELYNSKVPGSLYINEINAGAEQIERETYIKKYI